MNCSECYMCTYDSNMKKLCLDLETRKLLLDLIKDGVLQQFETYEFLNNTKISEDIKNFVAGSTRGHFNCLLPERIK